MARGVTLSIGEFYHIYNRGTDKRTIFECEKDYERFEHLLFLCNQQDSIQDKIRGLTSDKSDMYCEREGETITSIAAYCLMPNHFHLIVQEKDAGGISKFMQKVMTGYTMYFNRKYERTGSLFQGTFKAQHVADDEYLKYLIGYVHLNPVKLWNPGWKTDGVRDIDDTIKRLAAYRFSSYQDLLPQKRPENGILNMNILPKYFDALDTFIAFIEQSLRG